MREGDGRREKGRVEEGREEGKGMKARRDGRERGRDREGRRGGRERNRERYICSEKLRGAISCGNRLHSKRH